MKFLKKKKKRRKSKQKRARVFKPHASKYILLTFKTFISIFVFLFLIGGLIFFLTSDYFKISILDCEKRNLPCSEKERILFLDLIGENIFLLDVNKLSKSIKNNYSLIKEVEIEKKIPNKVLIKIKEREEFASFSKDGKVWFIIDSLGFILKKAYEKPKNLPEIFSPHNQLSLNIGQKLDQREVACSLLILEQLKDSFILLDGLVLGEKGTITLFLTDDVIASLSAKKKMLMQVDSLQFILRQSKIEGRLPSLIDLRFDKPVVRY
jgi:cell division protein FtsQ